MESAIVVQVGPCDSADDAQDRKVVANYDYGFFGRMTLYDSIQSVPGPARDIHEPLAAWNLDLGRRGSPVLNKSRRELMMQTEELSRLLRALQIA